LVDYFEANVRCSGRQCGAVNNSSMPPSIQSIKILIGTKDCVPSIDGLQSVGGGRKVSRGDGISNQTAVLVNPYSGYNFI
jgi:hypothetical protein